MCICVCYVIDVKFIMCIYYYYGLCIITSCFISLSINTQHSCHTEKKFGLCLGFGLPAALLPGKLSAAQTQHAECFCISMLKFAGFCSKCERQCECAQPTTLRIRIYKLQKLNDRKKIYKPAPLAQLADLLLTQASALQIASVESLFFFFHQLKKKKKTFCCLFILAFFVCSFAVFLKLQMDLLFYSLKLLFVRMRVECRKATAHNLRTRRKEAATHLLTVALLWPTRVEQTQVTI